MFKCPLCGHQYTGVISVAKHWSRTHKQPAKDLFKIFHELDKDPVCWCGCGETTKFLGIERGFSGYIRGHASRVSNNFQTKKSIVKSLETRKKMLKNGTWKPFASKESGEHWSKGLTKETDERIVRQGESRDTPEYRAIASKRMRKMRLDGTIPDLCGPAHSQWKGGISPLSTYCRTSLLLYHGWKYPHLIRANFKCEMCAQPGPSLEVHHNKETFSEILRKFAKQHKWEDLLSSHLKPDDPKTQQLKEQISEAVADYHIKNSISGIVLCERCHKKQHNTYAMET